MKKINFPLTFTVFVLLFTSCKKSTTAPQNNITNSGGILAELESYSHLGGIKADGTFFLKAMLPITIAPLLTQFQQGAYFITEQTVLVLQQEEAS